MSKVLFVLRHAQSVGKQSGQRDYERVLSPAGLDDSMQLGIKLKMHGIRPELALSSGAVRARQTFEMVNKSLQIPAAQIEFRDDLYEALMVQCTDLIGRSSPDISSILLVGHNPWLSMLASTLSGQSVDLAPCELLGLEFNVQSWGTLQDGKEILNLKPGKHDA